MYNVCVWREKGRGGGKAASYGRGFERLFSKAFQFAYQIINCLSYSYLKSTDNSIATEAVRCIYQSIQLIVLILFPGQAR